MFISFMKQELELSRSANPQAVKTKRVLRVATPMNIARATIEQVTHGVRLNPKTWVTENKSTAPTIWNLKTQKPFLNHSKVKKGHLLSCLKTAAQVWFNGGIVNRIYGVKNNGSYILTNDLSSVTSEYEFIGIAYLTQSDLIHHFTANDLSQLESLAADRLIADLNVYMYLNQA